ncbi:MAG: PAS domain-containing protein [Kiritimatiellae bacterium]|nr:PAS domain-containing protein [Kiritimatiellia bacterium]
MYDAVVITDHAGYVIETNHRVREFFGYSIDELLDRPVSVLLPGLTPEIVKRLRSSMDDDRHVIIDTAGLAKEGGRFACEVAVTGIDLLRADDMVFTIRNVERRRKTNEMLRAKEAAFKISHSILFTCLPDGTLSGANRAFAAEFGFGGDGTEIRRFDDAFPGFRDEFARAAVGEEVSAEKDGFELRLSPVRTGRRIRCVAGSVRKTCA